MIAATRRRLVAVISLSLLPGLAPAAALAAPATSSPGRTGGGLLAAVRVVPALFASADPTHDEARATQARVAAASIAAVYPSAAAQALVRGLAGSSVRLQPWPLPRQVTALSHALERRLGLNGRLPARPYDEIRAWLAAAGRASGAGQVAAARVDALQAFALHRFGPQRRLGTANGVLGQTTSESLWRAVLAAGRPTQLPAAADAARSGLRAEATVLGDSTVSRATVVTDAAVIVFREGLEAVLILAAITASFSGARRRLRRPVFVGAFLGLLVSAVTYALAQTLISALGDGGLRLQAITGLLAIGVLLVVTNWFFHKVYWSEWISRFNKRKRALERVDKLGFISGQTAGFILLGLSSVYREGFETVLFLQNLQVSAGTSATILGVAIGLAATLLVGVITFILERKLPYKKMLIATGVLIGLVLAVMTGATIHTLQGLGWLPAHATPFSFSPTLAGWLGLFGTWEGIAGQLLAMIVVYGSYAVARWVQRRKLRAAVASEPAPDMGSIASV